MVVTFYSLDYANKLWRGENFFNGLVTLENKNSWATCSL